MGILPAGLIDRARREGEDVTYGNRVIRIVEASGGRRRVQPTGTARVAATGIVKTIAHTELVARTELMVHLRQNVGEVDRV